MAPTTAVDLTDPCRKCPPGTFMSEKCDELSDKPRVCTACPSGTYNNLYNRRARCRPCTTCNRYEVVITKCSALTDQECSCGSGSFFHRGLLSCMKCRRCDPGYGVVKKCGKFHNTECQVCPRGTYSDKKNRKQGCIPCTVCPPCSRRIKKCSASKDTICEICSTPATKPPTTAKDPATRSTQETALITELNSNRNHCADQGDGTSSVLLITQGVFIGIFLSVIVGVIAYCFYRRCGSGGHNRDHLRRFHPTPPPAMQIRDPKVQEAIEPNPEDIMVRDLPYSVIEQLAEHLNPESKNDWRKLADVLGMTQLRIANLKLDRSNATQELLQEWGYSEQATTRVLYNALVQIGRRELADFLSSFLTREVPAT